MLTLDHTSFGSQCMHQCWAVLKCWPGSRPGSHPGSPNENRLTLLNERTGMKTDLRFSHDREPVMKTGSNVYIYIFENRIGSLVELRSGSQSSSYHFLVPLVLLLTWDCYSSPVCYYFLSHTAITFLPLLFFSLYYYYFFPIALIFFLLLLLFSHFVWWSHLIIKADFN